MKVSIGEIAKGSIRLAWVPFGKGQGAALDSEERATLRRFSGLSLDINPENLPLEVYLGGGSRQNLQVFPAGGKIALSSQYLQIHDDNNERSQFTLTIHSHPFPIEE